MSKNKLNYALRQKVFRDFNTFCKTIDHGVFNLPVWALQRVIARIMLFGSFCRLKLEELYTTPSWPKLILLLPRSCYSWLVKWYDTKEKRPTSTFFYHGIQDRVSRDITTKEDRQGEFVGRPLVRSRRAQKDGKWTSCIFKFAPEFFEWLSTRRSYSVKDLEALLFLFSPKKEESKPGFLPVQNEAASVQPKKIFPQDTGSEISDHTPLREYIDISSDYNLNVENYGSLVENLEGLKNENSFCVGGSLQVDNQQEQEKAERGEACAIPMPIEPATSDLEKQKISKEVGEVPTLNLPKVWGGSLEVEQGSSQDHQALSVASLPKKPLPPKEGSASFNQKQIDGGAGARRSLFVERQGWYEKTAKPVEGASFLEKIGCGLLAKVMKKFEGEGSTSGGG